MVSIHGPPNMLTMRMLLEIIITRLVIDYSLVNNKIFFN